MMDCKKALQEAGGDIDAAIEDMRKSGMAKAAKKSGRVAAEGIIVIRQSDDGAETVMLEVNCETDFVTKDENFLRFADNVAATVLEQKPDDVDALAGLPLSGGDNQTVEEARQQLVAVIGENTSVRRFVRIQPQGTLGSYIHGVRIGVLVDIGGGDEELARDLAMHIAASHPVCINEEEVPAEMLEKEKEIFRAQAADSGKPDEIVEKMVAGRMQKFLKEITLLGQPFVKDPDKTVESLLKEKAAQVHYFERYEVGEGKDKKEDNFAEEVMAQAKGG